MPLDLDLLADKLYKYRNQIGLSLDELSEATGIAQSRLAEFETGTALPTGDEILIFADVYRCDYRYFVSNERVAPFEQTEMLFRRYDAEFSRHDRQAVLDVLWMAECEHYICSVLELPLARPFVYHKTGGHFKTHGRRAAQALRQHLKRRDDAAPADIYRDLRSLGVHVFRRKLENDKIAGMFIRHPTAGKVILVNYNDDVYRQRFTVAHEAAHSILDDEQDVVISFTQYSKEDLVEARANAFASHYLLPPKLLQSIPDPTRWDKEKAIMWANKLMVNAGTLAYALREAKLIDHQAVGMLERIVVPKSAKRDPELPDSLSPLQRPRLEFILKLGLSHFYVGKCLSAYHRRLISSARMAEMLLLDETEMPEILSLFGERLSCDG